MLSGHEAVALWAYKTGYYERNIVQTEGGRRLLHRAGILENPYSIFGRESGDVKPAANYTYDEDNETDSQLTVDSADKGLSFFSASMQKTRALFKKVQAEYELAQEQEDEQGSIFYSHILLYLEKKAHLQEFNNGKERKIIAKNVSEYEETKRDHLDAEKRGLPGMYVLLPSSPAIERSTVQLTSNSREGFLQELLIATHHSVQREIAADVKSDAGKMRNAGGC